MGVERRWNRLSRLARLPQSSIWGSSRWLDDGGRIAPTRPSSRLESCRCRIRPPSLRGHASSAFAFAYAVSRHLPELAVPIRLLAGGVAYSRVHTGVHYPGDVVIGAIVGAGGAAMIGAASDRVFQAGWRDGPGLG
jgi:hypothetical protein